MIQIAALGTLLLYVGVYVAVVEAVRWYKRPRGIPIWPDLRRVKDLPKHWP